MDQSDQLKPKHAGAAFIAQRIAEIAHEFPGARGGLHCQ